MTARCAPAQNPHPLYLIEASFGRLGRAFIETDRDRNSRAHVIELIRSGEVDPVKVIEVNEVEGTCRDVTADILEEVGEAKKPFVADVMSRFDRLIADLDHARDQHKHERV